MRLSPDRIRREHADANFIGAWVEGSLDRRRRQQLTRHLADCALCRELASHAAAGWQRGRAARWPDPPTWAVAATAASVAMAAGVLWLHPAPTAEPETFPREFAAVVAAPAPKPHTRREAEPFRGTEIAHAAARLPVAPPAAPGPTGAAVATAAIQPAAPGDTGAAAPAATAPAPAFTPSAFVASSGFTPSTSGFSDQPRLAAVRRASFEAPADGQGSGSLSGPLSPAPKRSLSAVYAKSLMASAPAEPSPSQLEREAAGSMPLRRVSTRSIGMDFAGDGDSGEVDGPVPVTLSIINAAGEVGPKVEAGMGWAVVHGDNLLHAVSGLGMEASQPDPGVDYRAVTSNGDEVLAGGLTSQLWVSPDGGKHWEHVTLPGVTAKTAVAIQSIVYKDGHHAVLTAVNGRTWISSDAGWHWSPSN